MAKQPRGTHDAEDPTKCTHCAPILKQLDELARLARLSMRHQGHLLDVKTGRCDSKTCFCKVGAILDAAAEAAP